MKFYNNLIEKIKMFVYNISFKKISLSKDFFKYNIIGIIWTINGTLGLYILIDILNVPTIWASIIMTIELYITKYIAYKVTKFGKN